MQMLDGMLGPSRGGEMHRVLLVDDSHVFRGSLRAILQQCDDWEVCGEAENGENAVQLAEELRPDAILMDVSLPGMSGVEAARTIRAGLPEVKIALLTLHKSRHLAEKALEFGVQGYVLKQSADPDVIEALNTIIRDETYVSAAVGWATAGGA